MSYVAKSNSEDEKSSDKGSSQFNKFNLAAFAFFSPLNFFFVCQNKMLLECVFSSKGKIFAIFIN